MIRNKKIGILTFQNAMNYGAVLQAYSLQQYCKECGIDVEIIDYRNDAVTEREKPIKKPTSLNAKKILKYLLFSRKENEKRKNVDEFIKEKLILSDEVYIRGTQCDWSVYEGIIVGSDQIWNTTLTNNDKTYFLDGYHGNKYSYAASAGRQNLINNELADLLRNFNLLSVRESQLCQELKNIGIESEIVLDPTLLLNRQYWTSFASPRIINQKYILLYQMTSSDTIFQFAKKIAREKGCILLNANPISTQIFKSKCVTGERPEEWISLIKNAEVVITNSFHGLAFSINLNKEFYTEIRENEAGNSSRIESLLQLFDLEDRNICSNRFLCNKKIDYSRVNSKLDQMRKKSKELIMRMKGDCYNGKEPVTECNNTRI